MPRILVVYSRVGGGHQSAATALVQAFQDVGGDEVSTHAVDVYVEYGRVPLPRFPALYAWLARHSPLLWAALYHATNVPLDAGLGLEPFLGPGLDVLLRVEQPDLMVSVLPVVNSNVVRAIHRLPPAHRPRFEVVLTDWAYVHRTWAAPGVDAYTAPTDQARTDLLRMRVPPGRVTVHGIPVRRDFSAPVPADLDRAATRRAFDLAPDLPIVLVMVGAEGSPRALAHLRALATSGIHAQVVVVCGRNEELRAQVDGLAWQSPLRALGFTAEIARLMRASDLLVTKAGGVTLAEAFSCALPVVVNDVLPGQEAGNLRYALTHAAVLHARQPSDLVTQVRRLLTRPDDRAALASRAQQLARPTAAADIAWQALAQLHV